MIGTGIPLCANPKCQQPMPNWLGAINLQSTSCPLVCRKCFKESSLTDKLDQPRVPVELDQRLLEIINSRNNKFRSVVCLATQFAIQEADSHGVFSDPTGLLKKAFQALYPGSRYNYNFIQNARGFVVKKELWLPEGRQITGKNNKKNKMRLGEKIRHVQALPP